MNKTTSRLISERNLRFQMEMIKVGSVDTSHVEQIKSLIEKAHEHGVHGNYREHAEKLQLKMNGNIRARDIL